MACRCVVVIVTSENRRTNLKNYPHQDYILTTATTTTTTIAAIAYDQNVDEGK